MQKKSIGFKAGEYRGKNINSSRALLPPKKDYTSLERYARALFKRIIRFSASRFLASRPSKK
ncbi:MAG: hypothetical protein ACTSVV_07645 [Promethearchaeota archaeon]